MEAEGLLTTAEAFGLPDLARRRGADALAVSRSGSRLAARSPFGFVCVLEARSSIAPGEPVSEAEK